MRKILKLVRTDNVPRRAREHTRRVAEHEPAAVDLSLERLKGGQRRFGDIRDERHAEEGEDMLQKTGEAPRPSTGRP